ncbi:C40 family peptidase [Anaerolentibacter hominis]|uniref:C40 family peptidase n=1 Tax=Anaerolentibacter hominis TaxID=3079009 RepID=UPI0031B852D5
MNTKMTKTFLHVAVSAVLVGAVCAPSVSSATLCGETSLAGLSVSLERFAENDTHTTDILQEMGISAAASGPRSVSGVSVAGLSLNDNIEPVDEGTEPDSGTTDGADPAAKQAGDEPAAGEPAPEEPEADAPEEEPAKEPVSEYENIGISTASSYVNIRKKPDTDSKILGKLYKGCAAEILEWKDEWVKIKSGSVTGYINSEYLAIGFDAEELVDKYGTKIATVNTTTLKVREKKSTDSTILTLIPLDEEYEVVKEYKDWVKIKVDETTEGYVSKEYVDIDVEFEEAISIEEEQKKLQQEKEAEEALRKQQEEEKKRKEEEARQKQQSSQKTTSTSSKKPSSSGNSAKNNSGSSDTTPTKPASNSGNTSSNGSALGAKIAAFAQKFVGNAYVYGGTSLTNGADCSGFVQSVFSNFGIGLPRTSGSQSQSGSSVSLNSLAPGDLVFYSSNGRINHVAIYIGGGQVVHASSPRSGIKISNMYYRTPAWARRVI